MATTSRASPIPSEQVIIDVDYGYPVDPQPLPPTATVNPEDSEDCKVDWFGLIAFLGFWFAVIGIVFLLDSRKKLPRFQLDSVSLNRAANTLDIGFSIDKPVGDLDVWVRFMERDYKVESIGIAGNSTVSVSALLSQAGFDYSGGLIRVEQVKFRCSNYDYYLLEASCKDVALGFLSNETSIPTRGVMQGGPRVCPMVKHKSI